MNNVDITFLRAFKIGWSFAWRFIVLKCPVLLIEGLLVKFFAAPKLDELALAVHNGATSDFFKNYFDYALMTFGWIWFVISLFTFLTFFLALKWTLKTTWSDFRIAVVTPNN